MSSRGSSCTEPQCGQVVGTFLALPNIAESRPAFAVRNSFDIRAVRFHRKNLIARHIAVF